MKQLRLLSTGHRGVSPSVSLETCRQNARKSTRKNIMSGATIVIPYSYKLNTWHDHCIPTHYRLNTLSIYNPNEINDIGVYTGLCKQYGCFVRTRRVALCMLTVWHGVLLLIARPMLRAGITAYRQTGQPIGTQDAPVVVAAFSVAWSIHT